jgi:glycosyltransferase involved in cell wall biosynthesis
MRQVVQKYGSAHLVIAGSVTRDPAFTERIKREIHQLGLDGRIHLLGMREDIPELLAGADLFLHTARQDAHPRAVIEAMAAGLPVVAFGVDGVAETVLDRETGRLVSSGDCYAMARSVSELLDNPGLAAEMGQQGHLRVQEHFTAASTAGKIDQVISRFL